MSVEPTPKPILGNTNLHLRPFARKMARQRPELWAKFIRACERERATEADITPEEFIRRCTTAARVVNVSLSSDQAERSY